ncbi:MAG: zinc ABC transporter substrate-binding protein, partial [Acidimicrobiaceae bacterium]|nr:zinc ABC transporter substrate-binding protein [Acidimicrobiaceae bacterium]
MIDRGRRWRRPRHAALAALAAAAMVAAACSGDSEGEDAPAAAPDTPTILVTTGIWADVVSNVACDGLADIETIIPVGGDPHSYEPSLQDRARMENAALVVANGLELEEALEDTLEAVAEAGTPVFEFAEGMETIPFSFEGAHHGEDGEGGGHDEDGEEADEEGHHDDED